MTTIISGDTGISPVTASGTDASINGLTVGKGAGSDSGSTVVGAGALAGSNTGANNLAIGKNSLAVNTSGAQNTALGYAALTANSSGADNVGVGHIALYSNTTGSSNVAIGRQALQANTIASNSTAVGYQAGYTNSTGAGNIFIGYQAGYTSNRSDGNAYNVCVGWQAGYALTSGNGNTFVGAATGPGGSGALVTTGSKNTIIGSYNGNQGGLDIRTASNYIVLSDGDGNPRQYMNGSGQASWGSPMIDGFLNLKWAGQSYIGMVYNNTDAFGSSANIRFKNNGTTVGDITSTTSATSYNTSSDYRLKHDVQPMVGALAKISQLKPVTYKWNIDASDGQGFIAHELQEVFPDAVHGEKDAVEEDGSIKPQGIDTSFLVATLAASIQELKTIVDAQAAEIAELKAKVG